MPSWWQKNSHRVTQQDHQKQQHKELNTTTFIDKKSSATRNNKKKLNKEKPKSFAAAILLPRNSPRNSNDFQASSISFSGASFFSSFDMVAASKIVEKKAYPLPQPSGSPESTVKFDQKIVGFGSEMMLVSSTSSSASSSCSDEHDLVHDHEDFGSFRRVDLNFNKQLDESRFGMNIQIESKVSTGELVQPLLYSALEETKCNSSSRTSSPRSKVITMHASPQHPPPWVAGLESPTERHENGWHPCHPLPLPPDSSIKTSQHLQPKWKKGKLLGRGTFGHVYAGFNSENGQMCAMKEVRFISDDQTSKECLKQLNQEIALLSELSHPNIVRYYGSKLGEDTLSVYLEYVSGGSIQKLLRDYGPFKEPVIQSYTRQILSGLAYLHGRNTVHRDIKGANILVDPHGDIKLADFGMAKHISSCSLMLSFKGSPYWMAPEVIQNISGYSLAVDIWSLGCTFIEMATSKPPWSQYEGVAAIFKIANSKDFPEIPNYLSEDAQSFVKLCLQRDPSARPTSAQLLHHPFIQDQVTTEVAKVNLIDEAFSTIHGRHSMVKF